MNVNKLKGLFAEKGYTQQDIAKELGITPNTLRKRMKDEIFNSDEINILIEILEIKEPMEIFFANKVTQ
ncbi:helix-turn-helix domain-containing protein [uncultured Peptoniphilus sp.]|uniref:helix-turn-helix domain-containing protein n=1 Tax=uncultured Peptoniphilus sp. TaxID=254354 RepID=UPI00280560B1|nr:helix-turn-helix domain-containing protein [uncultured Peptoniphilus sp.]